MNEEYTLTITKTEKNPHYEEKKERSYFQEQVEQKLIEKLKTTVTINKEQWLKVQKAIVEVLE